MLDRSPISYVQKVSTPVLIQHGENDIAVPLSQGLEFYNALKRLGVSARMVVYPRMGHGPRDPAVFRHIMQDNLDWFEKHLRSASGVAR